MFESINICRAINEKTFEPLNPSSLFDVTTETIYAAVSYSDVNKKDSYFFNWTNLDTHEQYTTGKYYFSDKKDLAKGYVVSVYNNKNDAGFFEPGSYLVEFYHNDTQKLKTTFKIEEPEMKVVTVELASALNKDYSPNIIKDVFSQIETVFACVKFNYLIKDNTIMAKWFDESGNLILESPYRISNSVYISTYIPFGLQNDKGIIPSGNYIVKVYINDDLIQEKEFKVEKTEVEISQFSNKQKFNDDASGLSFAVPNEWNTMKLDTKEGIQVQLVPPSENMEMGYMIIQRKDSGNIDIESYDKIAENILAPFLETKQSDVSIDESGNGITGDGINYTIIIKGFFDKEGIEWNMPFCFFTHNNDLYVFYGIINYSMFASESDLIFATIIDSIQFQ